METSSPAAKRVFFRKNLVLPAEHGSWAWLFIPFLVGISVAGGANTAVFLVLLGGLAAFLLRQPATAWLRIRQGRGRQADRPLAVGWTVGLAGTAVLCFGGLLWMGLSDLLWLTIPLLGVLTIYLAVAFRRQADVRAMWMELAGAAGLAGMAPAAMVAVQGQLNQTAWAVWGLVGLLNALGVLYVRLRIADTHQRPISRFPVWFGHVLALFMVGVATVGELIPFLAIMPFVILAVRAISAVLRPAPILNIKQFGFAEVGMELVCGSLIVASYWLF